MEISSDSTLFQDKTNHKCQCLQRLSTAVVEEVAGRTASEEGGVVAVEAAEVAEVALIAVNLSSKKNRK